jgi:hypothetical protein
LPFTGLNIAQPILDDILTDDILTDRAEKDRATASAAAPLPNRPMNEDALIAKSYKMN